MVPGSLAKPALVTGDRAVPLCLVQVRSKLEKTKGEPFTMQTMAMIRNMIEGW